MTFFDNSSCNTSRGRRTNNRQKRILIAAMATNREILECRTGDAAARRARQAVWRRVMLELNNAGPNKNITEWRKVWTDFRLNMRKKWMKAQESKYILSEYEKRVIKACGMLDKLADEEDFEESEDVGSFLAYLTEELKAYDSVEEHSDYFKEENNDVNLSYPYDSNEFLMSQESNTHPKFTYEDEPNTRFSFREPSVECISDDESIAKQEFRESSVECISDDEEPNTTKNTILESSAHFPPEDPNPIETMPRPIPIKVEMKTETETETIQLECPEIPAVTSSLLNDKTIPRRRKPRDATLKEIKKMHRNLLRESRKQTALIRKLVQGMQR